MARKRKPSKVETRGRHAIPEVLRKVTLCCRVPRRVLNGFDARAAAQGVDARGVARSSRGLEIERAFDATEKQGGGRAGER